MARQLTLQQAAEQALQVQDACNLSGVLMSAVDACQAVRSAGAHTGRINTHPIMKLFAYKIHALSGQECVCVLCWDVYSKALAECKRIAEGETANG